jgi:hypothetical protein
MTRELHLPPSATYADLDADIWRRVTAVSARILIALSNFVRSNFAAVDQLRIGGSAPFADGLLSDKAFGGRSRTALARVVAMGKPSDISERTFGDVLRLPGLGIRSALELSCIMEAIMNVRAAAMHQVELLASQPTLVQWTQRLVEMSRAPWADYISEKDARFSGILSKDDRGTVSERIERILSEPDSIASVVRGPELVGELELVALAVERLERLSLDEALNELVVASARNRRNQITALEARFGWNGEPPKTLEEAARPLGVTRERVRQIESRFLKDLPLQLYLPQLEAAIDTLESAAPIELNDAAELLVATGRCKRRLDVEAIIETAHRFHFETDLAVDEVRSKGRFVVGSRSNVRKVAAIARKLAGMAGVASVYEVSASKESNAATADECRRILRALSNVEFLNDDWFWVTDIPAGRNRLSNIAMRVLSVASPQSVQSIREGVRRAFTYRAKSNPRYELLSTPPSNVLTTFFERNPEFRIQDGNVRPIHPLDYREQLGDVDKALVEVFRSTATGVLDRRGVVEACLARGLNESSVSIFLTYSPIVEHIGLDIWKLRGVGVDPAAIEALRQANAGGPTEKRLLNFGWRGDGRLWIACRLPYALASFVLGIPGSLRRYLTDRKFAARDKATGSTCGTIVVNENGSSFGYSPYLRISGAEPNDVMLIEFSIQDVSVELSLVDDFVLDADGEFV